MSVTLVHEWIESSGGAERVLDALAAEFQDADIDCLWDTSGGRYPRGRVRQSPIRPLRRSKQFALPFMPIAWLYMNRARRSAEKLVISSHLFAHHMRGGRRTRAFVYVHTPARYLWVPDEDPRGKQIGARLLAPFFRRYDRRVFRTSRSSYVANSQFIANRIEKSWGITVPVIYPPVDTSHLQAVDDWSKSLSSKEAAALLQLPGRFLLGASRFVAYKELEAVIEGGEEVGLPVVLAGDGPALADLIARAGSSTVPVHIVRSPSDALLYTLYQRAVAYVFPPVEDFGIMPVEAMAVGGAVIVNAAGGAAESVQDGLSGVHWDRRGGESFAAAMSRVAAIQPERARARARDFSTERFRREVRAWVR